MNIIMISSFLCVFLFLFFLLCFFKCLKSPSSFNINNYCIERCRTRAKCSVWWPGISKQLTEAVSNCQVCARDASPRKEPLMPTPLPEYPWQVIGSDLFVLEGNNYLLVVDYFSRYPEVIKLSSTVSATVIATLKTLFARHGIPEIFRSDNGPQYSAEVFTQFMKSYDIQHITSSPKYPK